MTFYFQLDCIYSCVQRCQQTVLSALHSLDKILSSLMMSIDYQVAKQSLHFTNKVTMFLTVTQ